jgi:hypothetical protein
MLSIVKNFKAISIFPLAIKETFLKPYISKIEVSIVPNPAIFSHLVSLSIIVDMIVSVLARAFNSAPLKCPGVGAHLIKFLNVNFDSVLHILFKPKKNIVSSKNAIFATI